MSNEKELKKAARKAEYEAKMAAQQTGASSEQKDYSPVDVVVDELGEPQLYETTGEVIVKDGVSLEAAEDLVLDQIEEKFQEFKTTEVILESDQPKDADPNASAGVNVVLVSDQPKDVAKDQTLEEKAKEMALAVARKGRLRLGNADLTAQEDALLREVTQLQLHDEGRSIEQKHITQEMVDVFCNYGSFLSKLGWLRAKYHESLKKK